MSPKNETVPRRWLITGGCGFIGTGLIALLIRDCPGVCIRVMDNLSVGTVDDLAGVCQYRKAAAGGLSENEWPNAAETVVLVEADIRDADACGACCRGADVVVHLAANTGVGPSVEDPRKDMEANVIGVFNMLEASRHNNVMRFVFASSGAPVGEVEPPIHEELAPHPVSPYGASKLAGEGYCSAYFRTFGLETVCLRFGNVYGPGSGHKSSVVAKFIKRAMAGEVLEIYGDGGQTRDFIFIEDLLRAVVLSAAADGVGGEVFQIATHSETTVGELTDILLGLLEKAGIFDVEIQKTTPRLGDVRRNFSDTSKAGKKLGWTAGVSLAEGLDLTLSWFMKGRKPA